MTKQKWMVQSKKAEFNELAKKLGVNPVTVRIMRNRDLTTEEEMRAFLMADERQFFDPFLMKDLKEGISVIINAVRDGKKIRIIGDYDADGITASYILYRSISAIGGEVSVAIPHRVKDGYGMNTNLINQCKEDGIETIITCDNGVSAKEALLLAKEYNMQVVVTDHHQMPGTEAEDGTFVEEKVEAVAVINPKQKACGYPFKELCGAGIAYKFATAMLDAADKTSEDEFAKLKNELLMYAAIGTVGDVMDLLGENRAIVKCGLNFINQTDDPSLLALFEHCGLKKQAVRAGNIGFQIAPCLNASGRIDSPQHAIDLLIQKEECELLAGKLVAMNEERKAMTERFVEVAVAQAKQTEDKVLVLYLPECHESIAGIVAGRIRERFFKPTLVITKGEEHCKGSGRSIESYPMYREMAKQKDLFLKFGGHKMAVGFSLNEENISILRKKLNQDCILTDDDLEEKVLIDVPMPMEYVTLDLLDEFKRLEPFGKGNPMPLFAQKDLTLTYVQVIGKEKKFVKLFFILPSGMKGDAVYFISPQQMQEFLTENFGEEVSSNYMQGKRGDARISVCYQPEIHVFNNKRSIRYVIKYIGRTV